MMILKNFYQISLELADDKKTSYILGKNNKFSQRMDGDGRIFKNKEDADSFFNEIDANFIKEDGDVFYKVINKKSIKF